MGLADRANLHFTFISSTELGKRNISLGNLIKIARALKVAPSVLLEDIK